ncbi:MAG: hypothetical protein QHH18_02645 [Candidatus Bathyarchaeota archaeon]|nr:hypothetical protein [Candidatus Bathyarchaeota archaeon A05DMB-5]MDH7557493.1 hypothetical protein [Candidatus Bathyarchaeota archaeon]
MNKKLMLCSFSSVTLIIVLLGSLFNSSSQSLACLACGSEGGVVDKAPCEAFTVRITFKNTGKVEGTWLINIAFEGNAWTWSGTRQTLTLKPSKTRTLSWNGNVPCDAPVDSVARLVVYYNDSYTALNWWIHVISGAELSITSSTVE